MTHPATPTTPVTALLDAQHERDLFATVVSRLVAAGLAVTADVPRRALTARQPAVTSEAGAPVVGLSQTVRLARNRQSGALAWLIQLDEGFRGADGSRLLPIADGDDVDAAVHRIRTILATTT